MEALEIRFEYTSILKEIGNKKYTSTQFNKTNRIKKVYLVDCKDLSTDFIPRKKMQRIIAIVIVLFTFYAGEINAQSKNERILLLSNQIDSLNTVLNNDRKSLNLELKSSKLLADSLEKALFSAKHIFRKSKLISIG